MAWKRLISWTVLLAVLAAPGYLIHLLLPPAARWQLEGSFEILGITYDCRQFWTVSLKYNDDTDDWRQRGPLQFRDMATGAVVAEYMSSEPELFACAMSPSGRFVVVHDNDANCLRLIDGERNVEREVALDEAVKRNLDNAIRVGVFRSGVAKFAANENYFQFRLAHGLAGESCSLLIDTTTGAIKKRIYIGKEIDYFLLEGSYGLSNTVQPRCRIWKVENDEDETDRLGPYTTFCAVSADLRFLVAKDHASNAAIWDLTNWQCKTFCAHANVKVSPASRWLFNSKVLENHLQERTEILDLATGKFVGQYQRDARVFQEVFSRDDTRCLLLRGAQHPCELEMVELPKGNTLWSRPLDGNENTPEFQFANDGSVLLVFDNRIELWDGRTGDEKASIWRPSRWRAVKWQSGPNLSKDRRIAQFWGTHNAGEGWCEVWAAKWMPWLVPTEIVLIADANRGHLLLQIPSQHANPLLTEDGRCLILTQGDPVTDQIYGHCAYDIPARPRWAWVVGVPIGLGGLVLGWRRWRQRKKAAVATAS